MDLLEIDQKLHTACFEGDLQEVRHLLTSPEVKRIYGRNADIDSFIMPSDIDTEVTPLINACRAGHLPVVRYLLTSPEIIQAGASHADIDYWDGKALSWACYRGDLEMVRFLMASPEIPAAGGKNAKIDKYQEALHFACLQSHVDVVRYLLTSTEIIAAGGQHANIEKSIHEGAMSNLENICKHKNEKILHYLVFEYRLPRSSLVIELLEKYPAVEDLFKVRESHDRLQGRLPVNQEQGRGLKV